MQLLEFVNSIRDTPNVVEKLVAENNFLEASQKVQKALQWCQEDLGEVGALQDLRHEIQAKVGFQIAFRFLIGRLETASFWKPF